MKPDFFMPFAALDRERLRQAVDRAVQPIRCQIRAEGDDETAEILIYDEIGENFFGEGISSSSLIEALHGLDAPTVDVRINSGGGDAFEGHAIYNALRRHGARVVTHVDALAASAASIIALAGDERRIASNAFLMIHKAWGIELGNADEMRAMADLLDKVDGTLADLYAGATGLEREQLLEWMGAETWFTAKEALEHGFVDAVDGERDVRASVSLSQFSRVPKALRAAMEESRDDKPEPKSEPAPVGPSLELVQLAAESERLLDSTRAL